MNRGGLSREGVIHPCPGVFFCEAATTPVELFADQVAHRPTAGSIRRRSLWISATWLRLRARRKPGMAMATSSTITATAIMISTSVNAVRANFVNAKPITIRDSNYQNVSCSLSSAASFFDWSQSHCLSLLRLLLPFLTSFYGNGGTKFPKNSWTAIVHNFVIEYLTDNIDCAC